MKAIVFVLITLVCCQAAFAEIKTETVSAAEQVHHRPGAMSRIVIPVSPK